MFSSHHSVLEALNHPEQNRQKSVNRVVLNPFLLYCSFKMLGLIYKCPLHIIKALHYPVALQVASLQYLQLFSCCKEESLQSFTSYTLKPSNS